MCPFPAATASCFVFQLISSSAHECITWHAPASDVADSNIWSLESRGTAPQAAISRAKSLMRSRGSRWIVLQFEKWTYTQLNTSDDGSGLFSAAETPAKALTAAGRCLYICRFSQSCGVACADRAGWGVRALGPIPISAIQPHPPSRPGRVAWPRRT